MRTFNYTINNKINLSKLIELEVVSTYENILIQVFCGQGKEKLKEIIVELDELIPKAVCIGTTTDGEIDSSKVYTNETVLSISVFEYAKIKSTMINSNNSYINGQALAKELIEDNTKLLIAFTDGTSSNGEEFLRGIENINNKIIVSGGMAGDNGKFTQTYISKGKDILEKGAVGVSLNSDVLKIYNDYTFNWNAIGVEHIIDEVKDNRVYKIDGITPIEFYSKYLGKEVANRLPATGIEFPLMFKHNGTDIARAVISKHDDGSLSFAGNLQKGESVRLGFGNAEMIINEPFAVKEKFCDISIESFFIYSCMARRRYMPNLIQLEIEPYEKIAPVAGFFTYGEFYHNNNHNELFNQTLTVVALTEYMENEKTYNCKDDKKPFKEEDEYVRTIKALTHLIQQSTIDFEKQSLTLQKEKLYSQELLNNQKLFMKHAIHETNTPLAVIMNNIELYEMENEKNNYLSNIEAAMKNIFTIYDDLSYLVKKDYVKYPKKDIDLSDLIRFRIEFFNQVAKQVNLHIIFENHCFKAIVNINETKLQRIIDNNITNAIKYTLENEPISIVLEEKEDSYLLLFKSKSIHIQHPNKVFDAHYREENNDQGFGLGLNLVKKICDEENIKIQLISNENETSFLYTIRKRELSI